MGAELTQAIIEAFEGLYNLRDSTKFNIAVGFFQKYSSVESDSYGKFYCDIKLHYKDEESKDVSALNVPLFYLGGSNGALFFELVQGDELLVAFSDKTLENWKPTSGTVPQGIGNPVKDSINHAIAIPIISAHKAAGVISPPVNSAAVALRSKPGGKVEIGNGTDELLNLLNDNLTDVITALKFLRDTITFTAASPSGVTGPPTNGAVLSPTIITLEATQTALGNIKT